MNFNSFQYIGPKLMENRKPFELQKTLIVYNFLQVLLSIKIFYEACTLAWLNDYNYRCEGFQYRPDERSAKIAAACWLYYISKFPELLDTVFFVMRKRYDQVSTLHVIHHGIMPFSVWWGVKFVPGGHGTFFGFLNSGVHIVMYTYYMLAAMGPSVRKHLWWKKYLTQMQMIQFIAIFVHSSQLFFNNDCNFPIVYSYLIVFHAVMFFFLFKGE